MLSQFDLFLKSIRKANVVWLWLFVLAVLTFSYSPTILARYLWADDWYGVARFGPYYGALDLYNIFLQSLEGGRPLSAVLWYVTKLIFPFTDIGDVSAFRLFTVTGFSIFGFTVYRFLIACRYSPSTSLFLSVATMVLPCWHPMFNFIFGWHLPVVLALIVWAFIPFMRYVRVQKWKSAFISGLCVNLAMVIAFFDYQSLGSLYWALAIATCFSHPRESFSKTLLIRYVVYFIVGCLAAATYFVAWKLLVYGFSVPTQPRAENLSSGSLFLKLLSPDYFYKSYSLFLDVTRFFSYAGPRFYQVIFGLMACHLLLAITRPKIFAALLFKFTFCFGAIFLTFMPFLFTFRKANYVYYRLLNSSMVASYFLMIALLFSLIRILVITYRRSDARSSSTFSHISLALSALLCIYSIGYTQYGLTNFMTTPRLLEYRYLKSQLMKNKANNAKLIHLIPMRYSIDTLAPYSYRRDVGEAQLTISACPWVLGSRMVMGALSDLGAPNADTVTVHCGKRLPAKMTVGLKPEEIVRIDMKPALNLKEIRKFDR